VAEHVLSWDYREQPDFDELARIVRELSGGKVHVVEADTQCDDYALVFADHPLTKRDATVAWLTDAYSSDPETLARLLADDGIGHARP
jgi:hypothetical protein